MTEESRTGGPVRAAAAHVRRMHKHMYLLMYHSGTFCTTVPDSPYRAHTRLVHTKTILVSNLSVRTLRSSKIRCVKCPQHRSQETWMVKDVFFLQHCMTHKGLKLLLCSCSSVIPPSPKFKPPINLHMCSFPATAQKITLGAKQITLAVGRIRTYAPRGNLISSQTP